MWLGRIFVYVDVGEERFVLSKYSVTPADSEHELPPTLLSVCQMANIR